MCEIRAYQVWGDMTADKSSDAYPVKDLCNDCASSYEIVSSESSMGNICEDCGCEYSDDNEELENRKNEIEEEINDLENTLSDLKQELDETNEQLEG